MTRQTRPQAVELSELCALAPHVRVAIRELRDRSRWALERGLWTDSSLAAESADVLSSSVLLIDGPLPDGES